jgi:hypothetical protein
MSDAVPGPPTRVVAEMRQALLAGVPRYRRSRRWRVAAVAALAAIVLILGGSLLAQALRTDDAIEPVRTGPSPDSTTTLPTPIEVTAAPVTDPFATSTGASTGLFTVDGSLLIIDTESSTSNGDQQIRVARWDPVTRQTRVLPSTGLVWRYAPAMAWTVEEVLIVGGSNGPGIDEAGTAYNPSTGVWRRLPNPPGFSPGSVTNAGGAPGFWTGAELLIPISGLAFDPSTETWRTIAPSPLADRAWATYVWAGDEVFGWGGCWEERAKQQCDESNTGLIGDGAIYDPQTDTWRSLPPSPLDPAVHVQAGWTGSEVVMAVTDPRPNATGPNAAAFNPTTNTWRTLPDVPLSPRRYAVATAAGERIVVWGGSPNVFGQQRHADGAIYDPASNTWTPFTVDAMPGKELAAITAIDDQIYVTGGRPDSTPYTFTLPPP